MAIARPIALAIELQEPLHLGHRDRAGGGPMMAMVIEAREPLPLVPKAQATHGAGADPQHLGHVNPRLSPIECLHEDLVHLHGSLHCRLGNGHPHLLGVDDNPAVG